MDVTQKKGQQVDQLFQNPDSRFRGAPFWAWNGKLKKEQLKQQIGYLKEMGMGGFHMHSRTGLDTPYMEKEFLEMVRFCTDEAKRQGMYAYLYDEDRWPSGFAGGKVTKNEAYRSRYLVMTPVSNARRIAKDGVVDSVAVANVTGDGKLMAAYQICLEDGVLQSYKRLDLSKELPEDCWYVYLELATESPWYNNQTYVDTLNPEAIQAFLRETHEKYAACLQDEFGAAVPSIFTDEPQFSRKNLLKRAMEKSDVILPYTDSFEKRYQDRYGESFFDRLPEIIWELADPNDHCVRYRYHELLAEQFASAFADTVGDWCKAHNIALTGHMMEEPTLGSQTAALGEAMRSYRSFQMPGIDMLCDFREYTTAKQAQSATHQYGREGVLSELYGVTDWDFDFRRHKLQGDWQAALGVTRRVHHLAWMTMAGEAKRDYPASIFYQSPWYQEYRLLEDHYARLNTVLMNGRPCVRIGVIHPIESYWLHYGPEEQTGAERREMEKRFADLTDWLLFSHLDFDFIAESLLPQLYQPTEAPVLKVGEMAYDAVIVPACQTVRKTTMAALEAFAKNGGKVIVLGQIPGCLDGMQDAEAGRIAGWSSCLPFEKCALLKALEPFRSVEVCNEAHEQAESWLTQLRSIGADRWLFVANGRELKNADVQQSQQLEIGLRGSWKVLLYNTLNGNITALPVEMRRNSSFVQVKAWEQDSFLLRFVPADEKAEEICRAALTSACMAACGAADHAEGQASCSTEACGEGQGADSRRSCVTERRSDVAQPVDYALSEPNALLLDVAEWRLDGGDWQASEEILLIDDQIRDRLGYHRRLGMVAQPWTFEKEVPSHLVELRFMVESEIEVTGAQMALEAKEGWQIFVNGQKAKEKDAGYFVDECIRKFPLPALKKGVNELIVKLPFGDMTDLEWCYLLGDFGVRTTGDHSKLTELPEKLYFGDYAAQGFPFYTGNMEYRFTIRTRAGVHRLHVSKFRAALLRVSVDGRDCGPLMIAPYEAELGWLEEGEHEVCIRSYGNRFNAFGAVHNCIEGPYWAGPDAWRTTGDCYAKEYQLRRMGILKAPVLIEVKN